LDRDANYFAQLVSERSVTKSIGGQRFRVWELSPGRANEALDLRVYAYAALCGLLHFGLQLNRRAADIEATYEGPIMPVMRPAETITPPHVTVSVQPVGPTITTASVAARRSRLSQLAR
jgi:phage terminase large subunit GpA-like protein